MWNANAWLQSYFRGGTVAGSWRARKNMFKSAGRCPLSQPGAVNISPGWFEMARDVSDLATPTHSKPDHMSGPFVRTPVFGQFTCYRYSLPGQKMAGRDEAFLVTAVGHALHHAP